MFGGSTVAAAALRWHCGGIKLTLKELSTKERDNSKSTRQQQKNETTAKVHQQRGDVPKTGASSRSKITGSDSFIILSTQMINTSLFLWNGSSKIQFLTDI